MKQRIFWLLSIATFVLLLISALTFKTYYDLRDFDSTLLPASDKLSKIAILDRLGRPLSVTYENNLNIHDFVVLAEVPEILQKAFVIAEDKRFFTHGGVDWRARFSAVWQNIFNLRVVRGASTISEQVVRVLHPRKRNLWSRWLEGIEAAKLEEKFSKPEILEFYLNEVPYAHKRRGVAQAARLYFDRDLDTLSQAEMLSLAALVRAPGKLDLLKDPSRVKQISLNLAGKMLKQGILTERQYQLISDEELQLREARLQMDSSHFVKYIYDHQQSLPQELLSNGKLTTTIDSQLQTRVTKILNSRIKDLKNRNVRDGAVLVVDHVNNQILAWVNSGSFDNAEAGSQIDAVTTKRQPGSTLKPFLYALAFEKGWTAATLLEDSDLVQAVGSGLHTYRNYSRIHYGLVRVRDALGNSLNIPAIRTVSALGVGSFLKFLHTIGFASLQFGAEHYGEGLALGNGEVTLQELVEGYATLARGGISQKISYSLHDQEQTPERVISSESASLIADILSDSHARRLEFGSGGLLNFPVPTAIKTGTSTDFRDVWAVGFTKTYTVGVWMGNLGREPMINVTGSSGPALVLRSVFHELYKQRESEALLHSSNLIKKKICSITGQIAGLSCPHIDEWFNVKHVPQESCDSIHEKSRADFNLAKNSRATIMIPTPGLQLAMDPRVPDDKEALRFMLKNTDQIDRVEWYLDGNLLGSRPAKKGFIWPLSIGKHGVYAEVFYTGRSQVEQTEMVNFSVK